MLQGRQAKLDGTIPRLVRADASCVALEQRIAIFRSAPCTLPELSKM